MNRCWPGSAFLNCESSARRSNYPKCSKSKNFSNVRRKKLESELFSPARVSLLLATRCPRCKVDQHYLNVLVAHVLLDQCHESTVTRTMNFHERLFVRPSSTKKRRADFSPTERSSSSVSPRTNSITPQAKSEEIKEKDPPPPSAAQQLSAFSSNDISSYKMSVLDGTHALEFTSLDTDGRQRKAHLCLFCGKVSRAEWSLTELFSSSPRSTIGNTV